MSAEMTRDSLCRLCGKFEFCINIFSEVGYKQKLYIKIRQCLPITVSEKDILPTSVCLNCVTKLNIMYEMHTTCLAVQSEIYRVVTASKTQPVAGGNNNLVTVVNDNGGMMQYDSGLVSVNGSDYPMQYSMVMMQNNCVPNGNIVPLHQSATINTNISGLAISSVQSLPPTTLTSSPPVTLTSSSPSVDSSTTELEIKKRKKADRKTVCQYCKKWIPRSMIDHHENLHFRKSFFTCVNCNNNFGTNQELDNHMCANNGGR